MSGRNPLRSMMESRCDQGRATVRRMIKERKEERMLLYARDLALGMNSADEDERLKCTLAMHGLFGAWLEMMDEGG